jgi:ABC-type polysaccharide/polyol phosphate export permease
LLTVRFGSVTFRATGWVRCHFRGESEPAPVTGLSELQRSSELLMNLTRREIRGKYKRTVLGQAWSLLNPAALMATYSLVFGFFLVSRVGPGNPSGVDVFAIWLATGLLPWLFFNNVMTGSMGALLGNANLILKVYFPRELLLISNALSLLYTHAIEMTVLVVAILLFGGNPLLYLPATAFFILMLGAFALGLGFMLAIANVYFRDTQHFVVIAMQLLFYLTPIVYPLSVVKRFSHEHPALIFIYQLNPLERFCEIFRNTLYDCRWPSLFNSVYVTVISVVVLIGGHQVFSRFAGRLAEEL